MLRNFTNLTWPCCFVVCRSSRWIVNGRWQRFRQFTRFTGCFARLETQCTKSEWAGHTSWSGIYGTEAESSRG